MEGDVIMLLWETLCPTQRICTEPETVGGQHVRRSQRLPFDRQCAAATKPGRRCRGRIREGSDFCTFHDPALSEERKRLNSAKGGRSHRRLTHIPDGYLRKLTTRRAVGNAMDRLYREIRLGIVTPEMGRVLFEILTRLLDSSTLDVNRTQPPSGRARADRLRPKFKDLLTEAERRAWRKAVADAPAQFVQHAKRARDVAMGPEDRSTVDRDIALTVAS